MRSNFKPATQRQLRVGEQIRHILADCFQRGNVPKDFLDCPPVSVMEVKISPDFSYCKAYISVLSIEPATATDLAKALNKQAGFFRKIVGTKIRLRLTPEIHFLADGAQEEADRIDALLASEKVQRDLTAVHDDEEADG
ncbi:MAG TPA: 30S ribosome-binding factor RbfA [Alphaproteobacteria bacterium]|nr:30S ribosome-binding factor RbfA [Alphaproteobacteria bacterium]